MENSNPMDELLTRSILNELDKEEEAIVADWLNASSDNRNYYESLKSTWQVTGLNKPEEEIDVHEEWDRFQQSTVRPSPTYTWRQIYNNITIAATIVLFIGYCWYWLGGKPSKEIVAAPETKNAPGAVIRTEQNTSGQLRKLALLDGSEVMLHDKSSLAWQESFTQSRRELILKGAADFKVAKDSTRPFIVYNGNLSVTALGTEFLVTDAEKAGNIIVRLFEGKVVVKSADSLRPALQKDIYLLPGQELLYDYNRNIAQVRRFTENDHTAALENKKTDPVKNRDNPSIPTDNKGNWYMFNNQSLKQVFDQLKEMYGVDIRYNEKDIQKMYFIGKFNKTDSLGLILKQICTLNDLTLAKENNSYIITR